MFFLSDLFPEGAVICNVEGHVGDRGVFSRASGDYAIVISHNPDNDTSRYFFFLSLFFV
jgi:ribosomal protein L2